MAEYVTVNRVRVKATDAILDYVLSLRNERAVAAWTTSYIEILADEMLTANEHDRTSMIHEMLFVIRGA